MRPINAKQSEITGILLFSFAGFSLMSLYLDATGWVGARLKSWLGIAFGDTAVVFGFLLLILAVNIFRGTYKFFSLRKVLGALLLLCCFVAAYHLTVVYQGYQLPPSMEEEIQYGKMGFGAGVVGAFFMVVFLAAFGLTGSYIILGALFLIGIILLFNISFIGLIEAIINFIIRRFVNIVRFAGNVFARVRGSIRESKEQKALVKLEKINRIESRKEKNKQLVDHKVAKHNEIKKTDRRPDKVKTEDDTQEIEEDMQRDKKGEGAKKPYRMPPIFLFKKGQVHRKHTAAETKQKLLEDTFESFGISAKVVKVCQGPVVARYELQIGPGTKVSRITSLADDLALALAATDVRIEAPVPGKSVVGVEVPNREIQPVLFRDVIEDPLFVNHKSKIALALGKDIAGNAVIADLRKWLHLLVAGATGSGKSVCLNSIIASILYKTSPDEVKLMLIDPKRVELSNYDGIPHLISPVVTDPKKAASALKWAVAEMESRYKIFADTQVKNIEGYHQLLASSSAQSEEDDNKPKKMPFIVVVVDELADLMMVAASDVENSICRLAQMARAAGIYLIIATQRPSVDVITGLIKANVPSRISFAVSSQVDSRTILDTGGAERLIGKGDMLYYPLGSSKPNRAQGAYISDKEVQALVRFWKKQGEPEYQDIVSEKSTIKANSDDTDELLEDAIRLVVETGQASISMLQRRFRIGYSRAARLIDTMEVKSIVGPYQGSKPREVLIDKDSIEF